MERYPGPGLMSEQTTDAQKDDKEFKVSMYSKDMDIAKCNIPIPNSSKVFTVSYHSRPNNNLMTFTTVEFTDNEFGIVIIGDVFFKAIDYIRRSMLSKPQHDLMDGEDYCALWDVDIVPHMCHTFGGVKRTYTMNVCKSRG